MFTMHIAQLELGLGWGSLPMASIIQILNM